MKILCAWENFASVLGIRLTNIHAKPEAALNIMSTKKIQIRLPTCRPDIGSASCASVEETMLNLATIAIRAEHLPAHSSYPRAENHIGNEMRRRVIVISGRPVKSFTLFPMIGQSDRRSESWRATR